MKKILLILAILFLAINTCSAKNMYLYDTPKTLSNDNLFLSDTKKNAYMYFETAKKYSELKDHKNAITYYTKAIELYPDFVQAYVGRAKDCGDIENWQCSLDNYEILKKMHPYNHRFYYMASLYKTNLRDLDSAMEDIDKAIAMVKKPNSEYYAQKAWVYIEKDDYNNAILYLNKSLKINPKDGYAWGVCMFISYDNEDYNQVIKIARKLLKQDPSAKYNPALYATYAEALYKTGKKQKALKQIEKSIEIEPNDTSYQKLKEKFLKDEKI